jgi:hypothetical protein
MKTLRLLWLAVMMAFACGGDSQGPRIQPSLSFVSGDAQSDTVGKTLPIQLGARLTDAGTGQPVAGRILTWSTVDGGSLFVTITQTGSDGIGRNSFTLDTHVGTQRVVARYIDPDTGEPVTLDTAVATAVAGRANVVWMNPEGTVTAGKGTLSVYYGFWDSYFNETWACADPVHWQITGNGGFTMDTVQTLSVVQIDSVTGWRQDFEISGAGASTIRLEPVTSCKTNVNYLTVNYQP